MRKRKARERSGKANKAGGQQGAEPAGSKSVPQSTDDLKPTLKRRPIWLVLLIAIGIGLASWLANAFLWDANPTLALPVRMRILSESTILDDSSASGKWLDEVQIGLKGGLEPITKVELTIGSQPFVFTREEFLQRWTITANPPDIASKLPYTVTAPPDVSAPRSSIPRFKTRINWPGDWTVLRQTAPVKLLTLLGLITAAMLLVRLDKRGVIESRLAGGLLDDLKSTVPSGRSRWAWPVFGAGVLLAALVIVETQCSYYFTQDDAFAENMPYMLQGCRSVFSGVFPEWNPYSLMGSPAASTGYHSLLYPPTYLAYFVATYIFGNENLMMEVYAILHLIAGYAAMYWASRKLGMRPSLAVLASLCFVLSGYFLICGGSWPAMVTLAVWTPLLVVSLVELDRRAVGWKWATLTGLAIAIPFYVGFSQNWLYMMIGFATGVVFLTLTGRVSFRRVVWVIPALLFGLAFCSPLLYSQLQWASDLIRPAPYGEGMEPGLLATLAPYPLSRANFPLGFVGNAGHEYETQLYYFGTLFALVGFAACGVLIAYRWNKQLLRQNVWLLCAVVAMLLSIGKAGVLWQLIMKMPLLSKVSDHPFRAMPIFNLFAILGAGIILERLLQRVQRQRVWELGLALTVVVLLLYHAFFARASFYSYGDKPYPPMPEAMARLLRPASSTELRRCIAIAPVRSSQRGFCLSMPLGLASAYSIPSVDSYDPAVGGKPLNVTMRTRLVQDSVNAARAYGIRWVLLHNATIPVNTVTSPLEVTLENERCVRTLYPASSHVVNLPDVNLEIRELAGSNPLAFAESKPNEPLPIKLSGAGADVDLSKVQGGGSVIVNILAWPRLAAYADGKPRAITSDSWGRVRVDIPPGATTLSVRYRGPWAAGILLGIAVGLVGGGVCWVASWLNRSQSQELPES